MNYEKFNHRGEADQVVSELRHLAGIVLDESSRLKTGGGKQKWALIKSARGIEFKLSLTATPAPNEIMEFASQAAFLEKMRSDNDIIWTYFRRDEKTHRWTVKQHARAAFFEFMAGWSIYVRDPRRYGWRLGVERPPEPEQVTHVLPMTAEQRQFVFDVNADPRNTSAANAGTMFAGELNAIAANKLSQAAKGFVYEKGEPDGDDAGDAGDPDEAGSAGALGPDAGDLAAGDTPAAVPTDADRDAAAVQRHPRRARRRAPARVVRPIPSYKPKFVRNLILKEALPRGGGRGLLTLVWTVFDEETAILARLLAADGRVAFETLTGKTKPADRLAILDRFERGGTRVLITRASLLGYGKNLQHVRSMVFSGWTFSYEQFYQAVRRAFRHGQRHRLRVHLPVIPELEGQMFDAIVRKQRQHEQAIEEMEGNYIAARLALGGGTCGQQDGKERVA